MPLSLRLLCLALVLVSPLSLLASAAPSPAVTRALDAFTAWDADHDERLSLSELDRAIASPEVKGEHAAAAVALRRLARAKDKTVTEFTRDSIANLAPTLRFADSRDDEETSEPESGRDTRSNLDRYYDAALRKINTSPRELFVGAPKLEGFRQGRLGTCFCLAPLTALAFTHPNKVPALFQPAPDGASVTVTFGLDRAITVAPLTDGEIALGTDTGGNGLWAATYEKAVGHLRRDASTTSSADATPYAVATKGGSAGTMLGVLTGKSIRRFSCKAWHPAAAPAPAEELARKLDELRALLRSATAEKRLMTAGTSSTTRKVPSLSRNHAYAVLGYDAATDLVTIRDPHGQTFTPAGAPGLENGYPVRAGIFQIPVSEVVQLMSGFAFQLDEPATRRAAPGAGATEPSAPGA